MGLRVTAAATGTPARRTRVAGVLLPLRPKLFIDLHKGALAAVWA
jgi:hypothetical protein